MLHRSYAEEELLRSKSRDNTKTIAVRNLSKNSGDSKNNLGAKKEEIKQQLELSIDEILDKQAYIWCCGKNSDGELGLGNEEKVNLPKNVVQLRDF